MENDCMQMKRIVIKIGSNVLTRDDGSLDVTRISSLVDQVQAILSDGAQVMIVSQHFLSVHNYLSTLKITDHQFLQSCLKRSQGLRCNAVDHNPCLAISRKNSLQDVSDFSSASADENMGRVRQVRKRLRGPPFDNLHILQTIFCPVLLQ